MEETLNKFAMEGIPIVKHDFVRYAKDLRKNRLPQRALEVRNLLIHLNLNQWCGHLICVQRRLVVDSRQHFRGLLFFKALRGFSS